MNVKLQKIDIVNFKGFRKKTFDFDGNVTISGRNASGKSTIADAFYWCLFGTDANQSTKLTVKRVENGREVLNETHSVRLTMRIDDVQKIYERQLLEVWTRPAGTEEKTLTAHKTRCLINDCEVTLSAFDKEISTLICSKDLFYTLSNPATFAALKTDQQRAILFKLSTVKLSDIAQTKDEYKRLFDELKGYSLDNYLKEIKSRKRAVNKELDSIPVAIEAINNVMPADTGKTAQQIENELNAMRADNTPNPILRQLTDEITKIVNDRNADACKQYDIARREYDTSRAELDKVKRTVDNERAKIESLKQQRDNAAKAIVTSNETAEIYLNSLRQNFRQLQSTMIKGECLCPVTNRACLDEEANICWANNAARVNAGINAELQKLNDTAATYKKNVADKCNLQQTVIADCEREIAELQNILDADAAKLAEFEAEFAGLTEPARPGMLTERDIDECKPLIEKRNALTTGATTNTDAIRTLGEQLEQTRQREKALAEIERHKQRESDLQQQLCDIERREYTAESLNNDFTTGIENEINAKFDIVRFKLFEEQLNGGKTPTCIATIDGVRYADLNTASRINAGLDIINTLAKCNDVFVPVFIDNAEAVNELKPIEPQTFELRVTNDDLLITNK